ncbi:molybdopterin molybdenumtransferase MoeA [Streptomyces radicis]|uniref:Molybdopterin molybdenumtransferase n=2 Tax=Streptomyces radicis TaxID=1750517 RepID=A0A3A9WFI9_9ACTN|nr:molybdopterin molybdotransferase MoeA [Streptomyces radicis]RKN11362.1 molybdopterin molybdenumtransferase MoeA [Streptomyces radicis]RKN26616.1 molybdopterin molybdenumtransferase MoeA [Streptomyces radicis]
MIDEFDDALALANDPRLAPPRPAPRAEADPAWEAARATAHRAVAPLPPRRLPLDLALGHTLAAPLTALTDLPAFDTSAMDGWAVAGPGPWTLTCATGALAGAPAAGALTDGEAVPIATGARIPDGATAVLRAEHGSARAGRLTGATPQPGADVRARGQECRTGAELLPARTPLTPAALGLAAAAGYDQLAVRPRPRAEVLVLGDELLFRGLPHDGRIRDALGPMTGPWLTALGAQVLVTRRLGDDADALREALATSRADLIVTTGSTAKGPMDHLRGVLAALGAELLISGVAVRPGHPMLLAELPGGVPLVGLPGNPLAAVSGLLTLAEPLLRALADRPPVPERAAALTGPVTGHPRDTRLVPVETPDPGGARPLSYAGPAMLRGIAAASALAVIPPGGAEARQRVRLLDLPHP